MATEFEAAKDSVINEIQGYLNLQRPGALTISLYDDGGDVPGAELYSTSVSFGSATGISDWRGASGLNWSLASGTYWVGFRADATLEFGMPTAVFGSGGGAPNPLGNEARLFDGGFAGYYWYPQPGDDLDFGVRIFGTEAQGPTGVPDHDSTLALCAIGCLAVFSLRRARG